MFLQAPLRYQAFYLDLEEANALPENQEPEWDIEYDTAVKSNKVNFGKFLVRKIFRSHTT